MDGRANPLMDRMAAEALSLCVNLPLASYLSIVIERHRKPGNDLAFATAVAVLSRAQFWLLQRHVFRNIFRGAHEYLNALLLSTCFRRCFRAWRFCFCAGFPTRTRQLNPFMEVFDAAQLKLYL